jgi:hypothetical protein
MKTALLVVLLVANLSVAATKLDLPAVGRISWPNDWTLVDSGTRAPSKPEEETVYRIVLRKGANELLSFFIRSNVTYRTETQFYADTSHELMPDGRPWWQRSHDAPERTGWDLGTRVETVDEYEALHYRFVLETKGGENLLVQGYVLFGNAIVFLQHTSARPTTPELSDRIAYDVMRELAKSSDRKNLRPVQRPAEKR